MRGVVGLIADDFDYVVIDFFFFFVCSRRVERVSMLSMSLKQLTTARLLQYLIYLFYFIYFIFISNGDTFERARTVRRRHFLLLSRNTVLRVTTETHNNAKLNQK